MIDNTDALGDAETEDAVAEEVGELVEELVEDAVASEATNGAEAMLVLPAGAGSAGAGGDEGGARMKVLLRDDVAGVGRRGDIVKVAGGFARNFLLPEGRAIVASDGVEGQAEQMRRRRDLREAQDRSAAEAQAALLAGAVIPITARAAGGGRLFGSVGPAEVADAISGGQGRRGGPQARGAARADQGDGQLRGDRRAVQRRIGRRDGGGQPRRLSGPVSRWERVSPAVARSITVSAVFGNPGAGVTAQCS